jgi:hypothetical protein
MMLVSLANAKDHLRMDTTAEDGLIELYIHAASGAILNYLKSGADAFLDSSGIVSLDSNLEPIGVPYEVQAATLILVGHFFKDRDENANGAFQQGYLPMPVTALLYPLRDPALS